MRKFMTGLLMSGILLSCGNEPETATGEAKVKSATTNEKDAGAKEPAPVEFAEARYIEMGKKHQQAFQDGNMDAWFSQFSDDVRYYFSGGDSIIGKARVMEYWKDRRQNVIRKIQFSEDIWLPVKINKSQEGHDLVGTWLLSWYKVNATYNTGKSINFWVHNLYHLNDREQVDRVIQYMDRAPILAATK